MEKETIVQFVFFETAGENNEFIAQWDQYSKGFTKKHEIRLQQEVTSKKKTKYLSQHLCYDDEFKFIFKKERRSAHFPEVEMRVRQLGGYTALQTQSKKESKENETKIFLFITTQGMSLEECKQFTHYRYLNIYKAYFESCNYDHILEFFVENDHIDAFMEQLRSQNRHIESGLYKECVLEKV
jgi:hypothetical protein